MDTERPEQRRLVNRRPVPSQLSRPATSSAPQLSPLKIPQPEREPIVQITQTNNVESQDLDRPEVSPISPISNPNVQEPKRLSPALHASSPNWSRKLGKFSICILILGTIVILGALSFTAFLWFSNTQNSSWHSIIVANRLTLSTTILGEIIKQAVAFQIGVAGAMLAAMAFERGEVFLRHAAEMTTMRAGIGAGNLVIFTGMQTKVARIVKGKNYMILTLAALETIILAFSQVITIVLTSDIGLRSMAGSAVNSNVPYGFTFGTGPNQILTQHDNGSVVSPWTKGAAFYPTFAEYSEPPVVQDGTVDTGVTLRAFLPYAAAEDRQNTHTFKGNTTVLDARVTCQRPYLETERLTELSGGGPLRVTGAVRASRYTPRLGNLTVSVGSNDEDRGCPVTYDEAVRFLCVAPTRNATSEGQWRMSMCQLGESSNSQPLVAGGLISEFKEGIEIPDKTTLEGCLASSNLAPAYGTAYLMLNLTRGDADRWSQVTESGGRSPEQYSVRGEWLDLILADGDLVVSMTLCYSSFDNVNMPVSIKSDRNRTETQPSYDFTTSRYDWLALRSQYGQYRSSQDVVTRGLLSLDKAPSWLARSTNQEPYLRDYSNLAGPTGAGNSGNWTAVMWYADPALMVASSTSGAADYRWLIPDVRHIGLFQEILQTGGSIAFAMQSLITLLSSMTYYERLAEFNASCATWRSAFVNTNTPVQYRGFIVVVIVLFTHLVLTFSILTIFLISTKYSLLNNAWPALAQAQTSLVDKYAQDGTMKNDDEIERDMGSNDRNVLIKIGQVDQMGRVGIARRTSLETCI